MGSKASGSTLDDVLAAIRDQDTEVLLTALRTDGSRILPPDTIDFPHQIIPVPDERETMLQLVVPVDRLIVVEAWERALVKGIGFGTVRLLTDPDRSMGLTIVNAEDRYGVWLGLLFDESASSPEGSGEVLPEMLVVASRPRQAMITKNMSAMILEIDPNVTKILGWQADDMVGQRSSSFVHPDDQERAIENWMELLSTRESQRLRFRHRCHDGGWRWIEVENIYHDADNPDDVVVEARVSDISEEMAAHEALREREQLFRRLAQALPTGVLQIERGGNVVFANERLRTILYVRDDELALDRLLLTVADDDRLLVQDALDRAFDRNEDSELEIDVRPQGALLRCAISVVAVAKQDGVPSALVCVDDITKSAQLREDLRVKATYDTLTGCYNRAAVMAALDAALVADIAGHSTGVLFIDLDDFKPINDQYGHAAGDELLVTVANQLNGICRAADIVGRLGGDEFLLVCRDLVQVPDELATIASRVEAVLNRTIALAGGPVELRASIGVARSQPSMSADELVSLADEAMYVTKRGRTGQRRTSTS
jgi:diguanylate cyclase (GGDEF)-like protein/PAS domain S-box-containing protein